MSIPAERAAVLMDWALASHLVYDPLAKSCETSYSESEGHLIEVTVTLGRDQSGFSVNSMQSELALLDEFAYHLADPIIEDRGSAWPRCPDHGADHPARVEWRVESAVLLSARRCPHSVSWSL